MVKMDEDTVRKQTTIRAASILSLIHWMSFSVEMSVLAFIVKDLRIDDVHFGYLNTAGALCQLLSSPFYSRLASANLRRAIRVALFSSSSCYLLTALAGDYWMLLASRVAAAFAHAAVASQTAVAASTKSEERTAYFGKLGATVGAGVMLGSAVGGFLAKVTGLRIPLYVMSVVCAVGAVCVPSFVDVEAGKEEKAGSSETNDQAADSQGVRGYVRLLSSKRVSIILLAKMAIFGPMSLQMTMMGVHMINKYKMEPGGNALMSIYIGLCIMAMNAGGVGFLKRYFGDKGLLCIGSVAFAFNGLGLALAQRPGHFFIANTALAVGLSLVGSSADSMLTSSVKSSDHALATSLSWAIDASIRVAAPLIGGLMLTHLGFASIGYLGVIGAVASSSAIHLCLEAEREKRAN